MGGVSQQNHARYGENKDQLNVYLTLHGDQYFVNILTTLKHLKG